MAGVARPSTTFFGLTRQDVGDRATPGHDTKANGHRLSQKRVGDRPLSYRTSVGTTLILLNGDPLISFVLTTV
jgi:hypothetical protein